MRRKIERENRTHSFRDINHVLHLVQELPIKTRAVMCWSSRKKKSAFFVTFILSEGNFINILVLSQCIVY